MNILVQKALKDYKDTRRKLLAYQYAQFVSSWNMQTEAMPGSMGCMSEQQSVLSELSYDLMTSKKFRNAVDTLVAHKDELDEVTAHETEVVAKQSGIPFDRKVNSITAAQRKNLVHTLKNLTFPFVGLDDVNFAIVTAGGVDVRQINPSTMESKLHKGLYFVGEELDVDAFTGGFNIQIALSTGFVAGTSAAKEKV